MIDVFNEGNDVRVNFNRHYVTIDENNIIIDGFSDAFREPNDSPNANPNNNPNANPNNNPNANSSDSTSDILINDRAGRHFRITPDSQDNAPIRNSLGIPLYKWDSENKKVIRRNELEINEEKSKLKVISTKNQKTEQREVKLTLPNVKEISSTELVPTLWETVQFLAENMKNLMEKVERLETKIAELG